MLLGVCARVEERKHRRKSDAFILLKRVAKIFFLLKLIVLFLRRFCYITERGKTKVSFKNPNLINVFQFPGENPINTIQCTRAFTLPHAPPKIRPIVLETVRIQSKNFNNIVKRLSAKLRFGRGDV